MSSAREKLYTTEDIYAVPNGIRAELINGHIYYMAPPTRNHQKIVSKLNQYIANYIDSSNDSCEVYPAPFAVFLNNDDMNYVEPDISVIKTSWITGDAMGLRIGLLKLSHRAAGVWITVSSFLNTVLPVCVNTGSLILKSPGLWFTI